MRLSHKLVQLMPRSTLPKMPGRPAATAGSASPTADVLSTLGLSRRECEVLAWVAQGKTNTQIATALGINLGTVKKHLVHIFRKLGVETRTAAAALAFNAHSPFRDGR